MDYAEKMLKEIIAEFAFKISDSGLSDIELAVRHVISDYEIKPRKNEIMAVDTESSLRVLKMFLVAKKVEGLSNKSLAYYKNEIFKFLVSVNKPVESITTNDIRLYIAGKQVSNATKDNTLRILRSFFGWCTAEEYVSKNPTLRIKKIKTPKVVRKAFSDIECEKLRNGARDKRERAIIDVLLSTGCRIGEIERLDRADVDGDSMIVHGKGDKERTVYLNARAQVSLANYLNERSDENPALFVSLNKPYNRMRIAGFEIRLRELGHELGIKDVHPHRFRRTAATQALNRGMPIEQVQKMLGHEQMQTTLIYAQSAQEELKISHKKFVV